MSADDVGLADPESSGLNDQYRRGQQLARSLPSDVQEILGRRSSRDPSTRFVPKLHALLSYVSANPALEDEAGVGWVDDNVFRMYKPRLLGVLGVKLNTLNVNLRNLKFTQLQSDKTGWTRFRREGFTRRDFEVTVPDTPEPDLFGQPILPKPPRQPEAEDKIDFHITCLTSDQHALFTQTVVLEWQTIVESAEIGCVATGFFVSRASQRYCLPNQPSENAFEVLHAVIASQDPATVKFSSFLRFMAEFGPPETVMLKIHSLLEVCQTPSPWLFFGPTALVEEIDLNGGFDDEDANLLQVRFRKRVLEKAWNIPIVPFGQEFVLEESGRTHASWQAFFEEHPVRGRQGFEIADVPAYG
jgi:hypothetical protein